MNKIIAERRNYKLLYRLHAGTAINPVITKAPVTPSMDGEPAKPLISLAAMNQRYCRCQCHRDNTLNGPMDRTFACKECYGVSHVSQS